MLQIQKEAGTHMYMYMYTHTHTNIKRDCTDIYMHKVPQKCLGVRQHMLKIHIAQIQTLTAS